MNKFYDNVKAYETREEIDTALQRAVDILKKNFPLQEEIAGGLINSISHQIYEGRKSVYQDELDENLSHIPRIVLQCPEHERIKALRMMDNDCKTIRGREDAGVLFVKRIRKLSIKLSGLRKKNVSLKELTDISSDFLTK